MQLSLAMEMRMGGIGNRNVGKNGNGMRYLTGNWNNFTEIGGNI